MKTIRDKENREVAVILGISDYTVHKDKRFYSEPEDVIQVGSLYFNSGATVRPHLHKGKTAPAEKPIEVLLIIAGDVVAHFYGDDKREIETVILHTGDLLIQRRGGHGFEFNSGVGARILEFKCGPYYGRDNDKEMID